MHMLLIVLELCSFIMSHRFTDFTVGRDILMIFIYISVYICPHTLFLSCFLLFIPVFVFALFTHPFFLFLSPFCRWRSWLLSVLCWSVCDVFILRVQCWSTRCVSTLCRWHVAWPTSSRGGLSTGTWQPGRLLVTKSSKVVFLSFSGEHFTGMLNYLY